MRRSLILLFVSCLFCLSQQPHNAVNGGSNAGASAWLRFFGDGNESGFSLPSGTANLQGEHWYTTFSVSSGATVKVHVANTPLIVRATGACTISGTVADSVNVDSSAGSSTNGDFGGSGAGGGGGAAVGTAGFSTQLAGSPATINPGGAGGAVGNHDGSAGLATTHSGKQIFQDFGFPWPIGGSAGGAGGSSGGAGGLGGGVVVFVCASVVFNSSATIDVSGQNGTTAPMNGTGGGGGGAGGVAILAGLSVTNSGTFNTSGGSGGARASMNSGAGGAGGNGFNYVVTIQ